MKRGGKFLVSTTAFAVAACGGEQGKLEIRSTPKPLAQIKRAVPERSVGTEAAGRPRRRPADRRLTPKAADDGRDAHSLI